MNILGCHLLRFVPFGVTISLKGVILNLNEVETKGYALAGFSDDPKGLLFERENLRGARFSILGVYCIHSVQSKIRVIIFP